MDEYTTDYLEAAAEEAERFREAAMILAERAGVSAEEAIYRIQEALQVIRDVITSIVDTPTNAVEKFITQVEEDVAQAEPKHRRRKRQREWAALIERRYMVQIRHYYESVENITESAGGADRESDAAFYERMRESVETYSTAGPLGGYEYFAKSASALIADVKATSPEPGEVDVRVLLTGGELPGEEILKEVLDILNADPVRPLTDHVTVAAPQAVPYNIDVTYYTQESSALSADTIAADVAAAVKSFQKWQAEKMGRDVNPSQLIALLMQTGVKRVEVRSPVFAAVADNAVAQVGTVSVVNGGAERE